jgi:transcriptional regulator with XRE-family HTH domain
MTDIYENISKQIRALRGEMNQETFAKKLQIAPNKLSRWETGTYKPTAEDLDKIARTFNVPISIFFPNQEENNDRVSALTSATGGLGQEDFEEILEYANFRKARIELEKAKNKGKS